MNSNHAYEPVNLKTEREWLAHWGDGPNWCSPDGRSVPVLKDTFRMMLDEIEGLRKIVEGLGLEEMDLPDEPEEGESFERSIQDEISRDYQRSRNDT
jgi:hypothetical protein